MIIPILQMRKLNTQRLSKGRACGCIWVVGYLAFASPAHSRFSFPLVDGWMDAWKHLVSARAFNWVFWGQILHFHGCHHLWEWLEHQSWKSCGWAQKWFPSPWVIEKVNCPFLLYLTSHQFLSWMRTLLCKPCWPRNPTNRNAQGDSLQSSFLCLFPLVCFLLTAWEQEPGLIHLCIPFTHLSRRAHSVSQDWVVGCVDRGCCNSLTVGPWVPQISSTSSMSVNPPTPFPAPLQDSRAAVRGHYLPSGRDKAGSGSLSCLGRKRRNCSSFLLSYFSCQHFTHVSFKCPM